MKQGKGEEVILNVYDLMDNSWLYPIGLGAYHSGVVIFNKEYTFSDGGVFFTPPKDVEAKFRTSISMGYFNGTFRDFEKALLDVKAEFQPGTYNLYTKNCNSFSNALCQRILNKSIPGWINRMAGYGGTFQHMFGGDQNTQNQAPVRQQNSSSSSYNSYNTYNTQQQKKSTQTYQQHQTHQPQQNQNQQNQQPKQQMSYDEVRRHNAEMMRKKREEAMAKNASQQSDQSEQKDQK